MSAIQIKKRKVLEDYKKELMKEAYQLYTYNHFRIGEDIDETKNLHNILMVEALSVNYCKNEK